MKRGNICFLYVVTVPGENGPVKIGITENIAARVKGLQTGSPVELRAVHYFSFPDRQIAAYVEETIHELLADKRGSGEWFNLTTIEALFYTAQIIGAVLEVHLAHAGNDTVEKCKRLSGIPQADEKIVAFLAKLHHQLYASPQ